MSGETLGRRLLRLDAGYCAGAGVIALALHGPLARLFDAPSAVLVALGAATVLWALLVVHLARLATWRRAVASVAGANVVGAAVLGVLAGAAPATAAKVLLAAVALEVTAFAAAQAVALRRS